MLTGGMGKRERCLGSGGGTLLLTMLEFRGWCFDRDR